MIRLRGVGALLAAFTIAALAAVEGMADTKTVTDPVDHPLMSLDPVRATHGHSGERLLVHTLRAKEAWAGGDLFELEIEIWLTRRGGRPDRTVVVEQPQTPNFDPEVTVRNRRGDVIGRGKASRPNDRSVRVEFRRRLLGINPPPRAYRWAIQLTSSCKAPPDGGLCGGPKYDRVPDRGRVIHRLHG
jgi:hypothetical protein